MFNLFRLSDCTKFGVDSSSRFPVRARTDTHTQADATKRPTHAGGYAGVGKKSTQKRTVATYRTPYRYYIVRKKH